MRTNKETLNELLVKLGDMTNTPTSKEQAVNEAKDFYLALVNDPMYGAYKLVRVEVNGGGHYQSFDSFSSDKRLNAPVMIEKLRSFMSGITFTQSLNK